LESLFLEVLLGGVEGWQFCTARPTHSLNILTKIPTDSAETHPAHSQNSHHKPDRNRPRSTRPTRADVSGLSPKYPTEIA
jgi:hypothetical protein